MTKHERKTISEELPAKGAKANGSNYSFVSSGCTVLDCALGGGLPLGRVCNIVGDKSTAKTALATEAITNFCLKYPDGAAAYRDVESAFDMEYAQSMGMPIERVDFGDDIMITVEELSRDLNNFLDERIKSKTVGIYVLDSLDALSDDAELTGDIGKATFGVAKAKFMSIMFRKLINKLDKAQTLLLIISQVRDNIGVMFGERHKRSGGRALDFYASQIIWLAHKEILKKTINKIQRPYGVTVKAKIKKNKVGVGLREIEFPFIFGYGVEDACASASWLHENGKMPADEYKNCLGLVPTMTDAEYRKLQKELTSTVKQGWKDVEHTFLPSRTKYPRL